MKSRMMFEPKDRRALLACALGKTPADLCLTNAELVNVITGEVYPADIYVLGKFIVHVEYQNVGQNINAKKVIDCNGDYVIPGFIDSHIHIESSMLTPRNFAKGVISHGTTTVITDPHEIANVYGVEAVRYMHDASENLPMRQLIDIPSCVPAVPGLENAGAEFMAKEIAELADLERVIGLAEVMDIIGVINGEDRMMDIMDVAREKGLYLQGHAPYMSGRMLSAYAVGGAKTCHESREATEFLEKMRMGIAVDVRESSITWNAKAGVDGTRGVKCFDKFCVCTDDREAHDILHKGHLNLVVRRLIECGMDPILAIKSATFNNAREARLDNLGAIAPGYVADMQVVESLSELKPRQVFFEGELVSENGKLLVEIEDMNFEIETRNSVNVGRELTIEDFKFKAPIENGKVKVNVLKYQSFELSATVCSVEEIDVVDGYLDISSDPDLKFGIIFNRYGKGTTGYGIIRKFGTTKGAIASTVSHDSHNLTVVFDNATNAKLAIDSLISCGGGFACAYDGKLASTIELKVGGLMSIKSTEEVADDCYQMKLALNNIGFEGRDNPLLRIVTVALPVIPEVKMSDLGLVDVFAKKIIPLFAEE